MIGLAPHPWASALLGDDDLASVFAPDRELHRLLRVEAAWTRALGEIERSDLAEPIAERILSLDIEPSRLREGFERDGVPVPALVELIKQHVGADGVAWVHRGLTSQDVMDTSMMMAVREVLSVLAGRLEAVDTALMTLTELHADASVTVFTRMQPAMETTVEQVLIRWQQMLPALSDDLKGVASRAQVIQWGGAIGLRTHAESERLAAAFARQLEMIDPGHAWHTDRARIADIAHVLTRISVATGKIGEDVALMAALGPAQLSLSGGTSSAMPHKNNPIKAEALIALSDYAAVLQAALTRSGRHEAFRSGQAWMVEWTTLPQLCVLAGAALRLTQDVLESVLTLGVRG